MLKSTEDSLSIKDTAPFPETKFLNVFEVAENITVVSILTADPSRICDALVCVNPLFLLKDIVD